VNGKHYLAELVEQTAVSCKEFKSAVLQYNAFIPGYAWSFKC